SADTPRPATSARSAPDTSTWSRPRSTRTRRPPHWKAPPKPLSSAEPTGRGTRLPGTSSAPTDSARIVNVFTGFALSVRAVTPHTTERTPVGIRSRTQHRPRRPAGHTDSTQHHHRFQAAHYDG